MSEPETPWSQYDQAYKRLHDRLQELLSQLSTVKDAVKYLPVRLTNGSTFYEAGGSLAQNQVRNAADNDWINEPFARTITSDQLPAQLSANGNLKASVQESLPTGSNEIGKVQLTDVSKTCSPWSATATSSGDNTVKTPSAGKKLRIKLLDVWNNGVSDATVHLKFSAAGTARFKKVLASKTGFAINLVGCNWEGAVNEALIISLGSAGTVDVTVMGDEI